MHSGFWNSKVGIGLMMSHETIGIHEEVGLYGQYSYKIFSNAGVLSFGISAGFDNLKSDFSSLRLIDINDPNLSGQRSAFYPNFGFGIHWSGANGFFLGLSAPYLLNNKIVDIEGISSFATQKRNYYLSVTKVLQSSPNLKLYPSVLLRAQEGAPVTFDLNLNMSFYQFVGLGFSYRNQDAVVMLLQLKVLDNLHIGYSYDHTLSDIRQYSEGTHEIMFNYRVKLGRVHQGLECPSYF
jgi:type IX secretion system PorP/SprF family membrane protein